MAHDLHMTPTAYAAHQAKVGRTVKLMDGKPDMKSAKKKWDYEQRLAQQLEDAGITGFFVDAEYLPDRKLRADILFPQQRLVVEIQGGAHRVKQRFQDDIKKAQDTLLGGYRLLPVSTGQVRDGTATEIVGRVLGME